MIKVMVFLNKGTRKNKKKVMIIIIFVDVYEI